MAAINVWEHKNEEYKQEAIKRLRKLFPIGSKVSTVVTHVSKSGARRVVKVLAYDKEQGEIRDVSNLVARVLGDKVDDYHGGVVTGGIGLDVAYALVYDLSHTLYKDSRSKKVEPNRAGYALGHNPV